MRLTDIVNGQKFTYNNVEWVMEDAKKFFCRRLDRNTIHRLNKATEVVVEKPKVEDVVVSPALPTGEPTQNVVIGDAKPESEAPPVQPKKKVRRKKSE